MEMGKVRENVRKYSAGGCPLIGQPASHTIFLMPEISHGNYGENFPERLTPVMIFISGVSFKAIICSRYLFLHIVFIKSPAFKNINFFRF